MSGLLAALGMLALAGPKDGGALGLPSASCDDALVPRLEAASAGVELHVEAVRCTVRWALPASTPFTARLVVEGATAETVLELALAAYGRRVPVPVFPRPGHPVVAVFERQDLARVTRERRGIPVWLELTVRGPATSSPLRLSPPTIGEPDPGAALAEARATLAALGPDDRARVGVLRGRPAPSPSPLAVAAPSASKTLIPPTAEALTLVGLAPIVLSRPHEEPWRLRRDTPALVARAASLEALVPIAESRAPATAPLFEAIARGFLSDVSYAAPRRRPYQVDDPDVIALRVEHLGLALASLPAAAVDPSVLLDLFAFARASVERLVSPGFVARAERSPLASSPVAPFLAAARFEARFREVFAERSLLGAALDGAREALDARLDPLGEHADVDAAAMVALLVHLDALGELARVAGELPRARALERHRDRALAGLARSRAAHGWPPTGPRALDPAAIAAALPAWADACPDAGCRFRLTEGRSGSPPLVDDLIAPARGLFVSRAGEVSVELRNRPAPEVDGRDSLSILASAFGVDFLVEGGAAALDHRLAGHLRSFAAHNTIYVHPSPDPAVTAGPTGALEAGTVNAVWASYTQGPDVEVSRTLVHAKPDLVAVIDRVRAPGSAEIRAAAHFGPEQKVELLERERAIRALAPSGAALYVFPEGEGLVPRQGREDEDVQGFCQPTGTTAVVPCPTVEVRGRGPEVRWTTYLWFRADARGRTPTRGELRAELLARLAAAGLIGHPDLVPPG